MLGWSVTCLGTGFVKTVPQFYASRILMGIFESGMYPALAITLTTFYTPREQGVRFSYLYLSVGLSGAFGGLFAYGLLQLDGRAGLAGWRWLFTVEGILSVGIAVLLWAFMPPREARSIYGTQRNLRQERDLENAQRPKNLAQRTHSISWRHHVPWYLHLFTNHHQVIWFPDHRNPTADSSNILVGHRCLYCDFFLVGQNSKESLFHGSRCSVGYRGLLDASWSAFSFERSSVLLTLFPKSGNICKSSQCSDSVKY
jgi:MFS family permease